MFSVICNGKPDIRDEVVVPSVPVGNGVGSIGRKVSV